jgi:hypothetical protein
MEGTIKLIGYQCLMICVTAFGVDKAGPPGFSQRRSTQRVADPCNKDTHVFETLHVPDYAFMIYWQWKVHDTIKETVNDHGGYKVMSCAAGDPN